MAKNHNIQQLGTALGVIASLLFVAYEIRQNTQTARATAILSISEQIIEWQTASSLDDNWIRIITFLDSGGSLEELSPEDIQRYRWIVTSTIRTTENRFRQVQLGITEPEDLYTVGGAANKNWFQSQHFLDYWQSVDQTRRFSADFVDFMESEVLELR